MIQLSSALGKQLRPELEKKIEIICREVAEKIAWEILPDLAENLVREQLEKISQKLMGDQTQSEGPRS